MFPRVLTALLLFGSIVSALDFAGTWKLNQSKSKLQKRYTSYTKTITRTGPEAYHVFYEMVPQSGAPHHGEDTAIFDGKERPSVGGPAGATEIDEHPIPATWKGTFYQDGKIIAIVTTVVAPDNKTSTSTRTTVGKGGKTLEQIFFFERQ